MTPRTRAAALVFVLLLAGCSAASDGPRPTPTPTPTVTALSGAAVPKPVLMLEPDGLGVLVGAASIRHLPFTATTAAEITTVISNILGAGKATAVPTCGQGPRSTYSVNGFALLLDGATWVGWSDEGTPGRVLSSTDGIGIGVSLATLRSMHPDVKVIDNSLGPEFAEGPRSINGFLSGTLPASTITSVYAGESCFFR